MWAPIASSTNISKLQRVQNAALRCAISHTRDTNTRHLHTETQVLPLNKHMELITSQYRESCMAPDHPQHEAATAPEPDRRMKGTAFETAHRTVVHSCAKEGEEEKERAANKKKIHTAIVAEHLREIPPNPLIHAAPPKIHISEQILSRNLRRTLAQLRAQKCPMLQENLYNIGAADTSDCPLCEHERHTTAHLFSCPRVPTTLTPEDLWCRPALVAALIEEWQTAMAAEEA